MQSVTIACVTPRHARLDLMLHKMKLGLLGHTILDLVSSIEHVLVNLLEILAINVNVLSIKG